MNLRVPLSATAGGAVLLSLLTTVPADAGTAGRALVVRRAIAGEASAASGTVPAPGRLPRPVRLEQQTGDEWSVVRTARTTTSGAFSIPFTQPGVPVRYRVVAPRTGRAPAAETTSTDAVPVPQSAGLTAPVGTRPGGTVKVTVTARPKRPGRPFTVQRWDPVRSAWSVVASGRVGAAGTASAAVTPPRGFTGYRVAVGSWHGAVGVKGDTVSIAADTARLVTATGKNAPLGLPAGTEYDVTSSWVVFTRAGAVRARSLATGESRLVAANGSRPRISGRLVAFESRADGRSDVFVHDLTTGLTTMVTGGLDHAPDGASSSPVLAGEKVAYLTDAEEITGDPARRVHAVLTDLRTGSTRVVDIAVDGGPADGDALDVAVGDSGAVAFRSEASNLWHGDANERADLFVWQPGRPIDMVTWNSGATPVDWDLSANGRTLVLSSPDAPVHGAPDGGGLYSYDTVQRSMIRVATRMATQLDIGYYGSRVTGVFHDVVDGRRVSRAHYLDPSRGIDAIAAQPWSGRASRTTSGRPVLDDGAGRVYVTSADPLMSTKGRPGAGDVFSRPLVWNPSPAS